MSKVPTTPVQMADRLAALFPPPLTPALLADYGLGRVASQATPILRELLSLMLFWMQSALDAHYRGIGDVLVWPEVQRRLRERWKPGYGLAETEWEPFLAELPERAAAYQRVKEEGGSAVSVSSEAAAYLESNWVVRSEERGALLALFVDLVPVDGIGELFEEIELVAPS